MEITLELVTLIGGLLLILFGANYLVNGSSDIARRFGISEFVIGLTIVGIGTSAPEMVVSFMSAVKGNADMAIGNVVGSNIFNTFMILGFTALISPLAITKENIRRDIPVNIAASVILILLGMSGTIFGIGSNMLGRFDAVILLAFFAWYMATSFKTTQMDESDEAETPVRTTWLSIAYIVAGLAGLIFGGRVFVDSATELAKIFGVSDKFIAITVLAGGTSMPELATCIVAALKGKGQLALGNILGSNVFNILLILGGSALITPLSFTGMSNIDLGVLLIGSVFLLLSAYLFRKNKLDRIEAVILLLIEAAYMWYLIQNL